MVRTTVFQSNRSQAVRLPKDVAFPDGVKQVTVLRDGKRRVIVPSNSLWDEFFDAPGIDLGPRAQPSAQVRVANPMATQQNSPSEGNLDDPSPCPPR